MKNRILLTYFALLLMGIHSHAQSDAPLPCGTSMGISPWLRHFQQTIEGRPRNFSIKSLPLQVHVVGTDEGAGYMPINTVLRSFCTLNNDFAQADIQFYQAGPIHYINNSEYYEHDFWGGIQMMNEHNVPGAINCYIVEDAAGNCGYYVPGDDGVVLAKGCTQPNDHTWAHEVGHFLSLPHPFFGWEWADSHNYNNPAPADWDGWPVEKVDGSNCQEAGDGFCDTAPDYLNYRWNCTIDNVSSVLQTDPDGQTFVSDGTLFMSYSNPFCKSRFSADQIAAMHANVEEERPDLMDNILIPSTIDIEPITDITVISPEPDVPITTAQVLLEWEPLENATHYVVQVNPFSLFSIVFNEFVVDEPRLLFDNLQPNRTFYWRIFPFNSHNSCVGFSVASTFQTGFITDVDDFSDEDATIKIFPNPADGINGCTYSWPHLTTATLRLTDVSGKEVGYYPEVNTPFHVPTTALADGMYFLQIEQGNKKWIRKLVIH
ncbi:MAG: zinc-dependent metalloprotease [Saprospiraceae bacterium]